MSCTMIDKTGKEAITLGNEPPSIYEKKRKIIIMSALIIASDTTDPRHAIYWDTVKLTFMLMMIPPWLTC